MGAAGVPEAGRGADGRFVRGGRGLSARWGGFKCAGGMGRVGGGRACGYRAVCGGVRSSVRCGRAGVRPRRDTAKRGAEQAAG